MGNALKLIGMVAKIGEAIADGIKSGKSNAQIRADVDDIVNDKELGEMKRAAKRVDDYLNSLPGD